MQHVSTKSAQLRKNQLSLQNRAWLPDNKERANLVNWYCALVAYFPIFTNKVAIKKITATQLPHSEPWASGGSCSLDNPAFLTRPCLSAIFSVFWCKFSFSLLSDSIYWEKQISLHPGKCHFYVKLSDNWDTYCMLWPKLYEAYPPPK